MNIRDARPDDAPALATLIDYAGEGIPGWLWSQSAAPGQTAEQVGCERAAREEGVEYKDAPFSMPVRRLDDVKAARELDLRYVPD